MKHTISPRWLAKTNWGCIQTGGSRNSLRQSVHITTDHVIVGSNFTRLFPSMTSIVKSSYHELPYKNEMAIKKKIKEKRRLNKERDIHTCVKKKRGNKLWPQWFGFEIRVILTTKSIGILGLRSVHLKMTNWAKEGMVNEYSFGINVILVPQWTKS